MARWQALAQDALWLKAETPGKAMEAFLAFEKQLAEEDCPVLDVTVEEY